MERLQTLEAARADYAEDFYAWTGAQTALLRNGRLRDADIENLIEEIDGLGTSQQSALVSQMARVIEHLLKLEYSPAQLPRRGWRNSIIDARVEIERLLKTSPSLRRVADQELAYAIASTARATIAKLRNFDELDAVGERRMRERTYTTDQVIGDWFPEA